MHFLFKSKIISKQKKKQPKRILQAKCKRKDKPLPWKKTLGKLENIFQPTLQSREFLIEMHLSLEFFLNVVFDVRF